MRNVSSLVGTVCLLAALGSHASAEDLMPWQPSLEAAQRAAVQTRRLVLIHFWAPWCAPCMNLERHVFAQPETAAALAPNFVLVKLNADDARATARMYQVTTLPTDVIITPDGRLVEAIPSPSVAADYVARMNQVAAAFARGASVQYAVARPVQQNPYSTPQASPAAQPGGAPPIAGPPSVPSGAAQQASLVTANASYRAQVQPPGNPALVGTNPELPPSMSNLAPGGQPPANAAPGLPPDALDGFCAVTLVEHKRWVKGDPAFGAIHRDRTYKFVSQEAQRRFLANPDAFSPVMQGNDPVVALDAHQAVPGRRDHGLFFQNRIYLFSNEESLKRFQASPSRYAAEVVQAMR